MADEDGLLTEVSPKDLPDFIKKNLRWKPEVLIQVAHWILNTPAYDEQDHSTVKELLDSLAGKNYIDEGTDPANKGLPGAKKYKAFIELLPIVEEGVLCSKMRLLTVRGQGIDKYPTDKEKELTSKFVLDRGNHVKVFMIIHKQISQREFKRLKEELREMKGGLDECHAGVRSFLELWKIMVDGNIVPSEFTRDGYDTLLKALKSAQLGKLHEDVKQFIKTVQDKLPEDDQTSEQAQSVQVDTL